MVACCHVLPGCVLASETTTGLAAQTPENRVSMASSQAVHRCGWQDKARSITVHVVFFGCVLLDASDTLHPEYFRARMHLM